MKRIHREFEMSTQEIADILSIFLKDTHRIASQASIVMKLCKSDNGVEFVTVQEFTEESLFPPNRRDAVTSALSGKSIMATSSDDQAPPTDVPSAKAAGAEVDGV